jgi:hypothetical protein
MVWLLGFGFDWSNVSHQELPPGKDSCQLTIRKYQLFLSSCSCRPFPEYNSWWFSGLSWRFLTVRKNPGSGSASPHTQPTFVCVCFLWIICFGHHRPVLTNLSHRLRASHMASGPHPAQCVRGEDALEYINTLIIQELWSLDAEPFLMSLRNILHTPLVHTVLYSFTGWTFHPWNTDTLDALVLISAWERKKTWTVMVDLV